MCVSVTLTVCESAHVRARASMCVRAFESVSVSECVTVWEHVRENVRVSGCVPVCVCMCECECVRV